MPKIIPIKDLKNTSGISELCHSTDEPVFITKNGYSDMVVMSNQAYDKLIEQIHLYQLVAEAEQDVEEGNVFDGKEVTMQVKVGDKVIYSKYSGTEVEVEEEKYVVVKQNDILAVIE